MIDRAVSKSEQQAFLLVQIGDSRVERVELVAIKGKPRRQRCWPGRPDAPEIVCRPWIICLIRWKRSPSGCARSSGCARLLSDLERDECDGASSSLHSAALPRSRWWRGRNNRHCR
jgi:hypothetical protein